MIDIIFTIDYEIYGNGLGSLQELVYEPAERLIAIFRKWDAHFVAFVEIAEIEMIDSKRTDEAIDKVKAQIRDLYKQGVEIGLHLHSQWYGADYQNGRWSLNYNEYNLCTLPRKRIISIIERSIAYLRTILRENEFTPIVFRAGNWLFQPTQIVAEILSNYGIKIDSSVFKGGLQHHHKLDYRRALRNGYYWTFMHHIDVPDTNGILLEVPIYTQMVPGWKLLTPKRLSIHEKGIYTTRLDRKKEFNRLLDLLRLRHPLKLDFCRMTLSELKRMTESIIRDDSKTPQRYRPIVAIGHTKELDDIETVDTYLGYLKSNGITISTFHEVYPRCLQQQKV